MKTCSKCGETKSGELFPKQGRQCKACAYSRSRRWREANPERVREMDCKRREANRERNRETSRKWREANPERAKEAGRKWREANPGRLRALSRRCVYGIEPETVSALADIQSNSCAICRTAFESTPHVDHCHASNVVRGLLCKSCNLGLGHFRDDPARLTAAIEYLANPPSQRFDNTHTPPV